MNGWTMKRWMSVPALLLAGLVLTGAAQAQALPPAAGDDADDDVTLDWVEDGGPAFEFEGDADFALAPDDDDRLAGGDSGFDGPGGLSGPSVTRQRDGEKRIRTVIVRERQGGPGDGMRLHRHDGPGFGRGGRHLGMGQGMGMGMGMRGRHARRARELDLTDRQKEQMAEIHEGQARRMIAVRSGLAEARLDLRKLMRAETPNQAQIDATVDRMAKLRADGQKARIATMLAARNVLTPEQRKKLHGDGTRGEGPGEGRGLRMRIERGGRGGGR